MSSGDYVKQGALVAVLSALVGLLSAVLTLYTQAASIVDPLVESRIRKDFAPVGTIVASQLPPVEFAKATGETEGDDFSKRTWILADGRKVTGTVFAKLTGDKAVPDLRGVFLRGLDPNGSRQAGDLEGYSTALPTANRFGGVTAKAGDHVHAGGMQLSKVGDRYNAGGQDYLVAVAANTLSGGEHTHVVDITGGGDPETRPVNVAVFYYIKIN